MIGLLQNQVTLAQQSVGTPAANLSRSFAHVPRSQTMPKKTEKIGLYNGFQSDFRHSGHHSQTI
jgi:hypothetical protein